MLLRAGSLSEKGRPRQFRRPVQRQCQQRWYQPPTVKKPDHTENSNGDIAGHLPKEGPERTVPYPKYWDPDRCTADIGPMHRQSAVSKHVGVRRVRLQQLSGRAALNRHGDRGDDKRGGDQACPKSRQDP